MSNLKKNQQVSFDYDKLAEAIVKAENKVRKEENKIDNPAWFLRLILILTFASIALFFILCFIAFVWLIFTGEISPKNIIEIIARCILGCITFSYAIFAIILTWDISKIKDKSYLLNYFGAITGLLALVISIITFLRGV